MLNNDILVEEIKEKDEDALKHLHKLEYENEAGSNNFTITFHFSANDYFTNEVLTKKFYISEDDEVTKTEGTEIKWKEGKNLTVKTIKKTQKNKKTNAKRTVTKEV
jgi:nucleosome assembly protein 1-like 1